jgi:UBX domain-containing protein 1
MSAAENLEMFMSVTGASRDVALRHLDATMGDVQQAILEFYDSPMEADPSASEAPRPEAASGGQDSNSIESIMGLAKEGGEGGKGSGKKGSGKGKDDRPARKIGIVFFSDGFMVDDEPDEDTDEEETPSAPEAPKPPTRGIRMMSLDDLPRETRGGRPPLPKKLPKLAPLRSYDTPENKKFLEDVKKGVLPPSLQQKDENGRPIPTTIGVSDERPRSYAELSQALEKLKKMKEEEDAEKQPAPKSGPALFSGAGQTLSSAAPSASAAATAASGGGACDPGLLKLVKDAPAPEVDESKPATTLQLRLSTGARVKARLNLDHTVADLWRLVAKEHGQAAFQSASGHELVAGFPPKPLADTSATLAAADLANASVTHRCRP